MQCFIVSVLLVVISLAASSEASPVHPNRRHHRKSSQKHKDAMQDKATGSSNEFNRMLSEYIINQHQLQSALETSSAAAVHQGEIKMTTGHHRGLPTLVVPKRPRRSATTVTRDLLHLLGRAEEETKRTWQHYCNLGDIQEQGVCEAVALEGLREHNIALQALKERNMRLTESNPTTSDVEVVADLHNTYSQLIRAMHGTEGEFLAEQGLGCTNGEDCPLNALNHVLTNLEYFLSQLSSVQFRPESTSSQQLVSHLQNSEHRQRTRTLSLSVLQMFMNELDWVLTHPTLAARR